MRLLRANAAANLAPDDTPPTIFPKSSLGTFAKTKRTIEALENNPNHVSMKVGCTIVEFGFGYRVGRNLRGSAHARLDRAGGAFIFPLLREVFGLLTPVLFLSHFRSFAPHRRNATTPTNVLDQSGQISFGLMDGSMDGLMDGRTETGHLIEIEGQRA